MGATEKPDIEYHQKQEIRPKNIWKELAFIEIGIIILAVGYYFYLNNSTALILNFNNENTTRVVNGVPNPPNTVLYNSNDYVPKSNVSNTQTFFGITITLALVVILLTKRMQIPRRATIQEAIHDIASQLIKIRQLKDVKISATRQGLLITSDLEVIELKYNFLTRYKTEGSRRWAFRYTIGVIITDKEDDVPVYYKAFYHPWSRYWDGLVETTKWLNDEDRCPRCGSDYDEMIVMAEDLMKWKHARGYVGEKGIKL